MVDVWLGASFAGSVRLDGEGSGRFLPQSGSAEAQLLGVRPVGGSAQAVGSLFFEQAIRYGHFLSSYHHGGLTTDTLVVVCAKRNLLNKRLGWLSSVIEKMGYGPFRTLVLAVEGHDDEAPGALLREAAGFGAVAVSRPGSLASLLLEIGAARAVHLPLDQHACEASEQSGAAAIIPSFLSGSGSPRQSLKVGARAGEVGGWEEEDDQYTFRRGRDAATTDALWYALNVYLFSPQKRLPEEAKPAHARLLNTLRAGKGGEEQAPLIVVDDIDDLYTVRRELSGAPILTTLGMLLDAGHSNVRKLTASALQDARHVINFSTDASVEAFILNRLPRAFDSYRSVFRSVTNPDIERTA